MRTYQVTQREGENMGPIDWSYDFLQHFQLQCTSDERRRESCDRCVALLKEAVEAHKAGKIVEVQINDYQHPLYDVGMYDGWPYWKPTPALLCGGTLGCEWHFFNDLRAVNVRTS